MSSDLISGTPGHERLSDTQRNKATSAGRAARRNQLEGKPVETPFEYADSMGYEGGQFDDAVSYFGFGYQAEYDKTKKKGKR